MRKGVGVILCLAVLVMIVVLGQITEYLLSEYVYRTHQYKTNIAHAQYRYDIGVSSREIPNHIHQIYFLETVPVLPDDLKSAQESWITQHPDYKFTFWNKTSINSLIDRKYPKLRDLYDSYEHWVMRVDVARYLVLREYGGWYVDTDIRCKHRLSNLTNEAHSQNSTLVLRWTEPDGCSNDFIGVSPHHPFFEHVLNGLPAAHRWYIFPYATVMFSTGPMFLWGRFLNYPFKDELYKVTDYSKYFDILHGSSWHKWDGKIVWYFFNHRLQFWIGLIILIISCTSLIIFKRCLKERKAVNGMCSRPNWGI